MMPNQQLRFRWEVNVVDASDVEVRLLMRPVVEGMQKLEDVAFDGKIAGPYCEHAHTLPAKVALRFFREGSSVCAESIIPDPCYWTPDLPYLYRLSIACRRGDEVLEEYEQMIGLQRAERFVGPLPK